MNAKQARELSNSNGFEAKVNEKIREVERCIERACGYGHTSTCVFGNYGHNLSDVDRAVKKHFQELGYTFKRTPMNGGVIQDTEDICW